MHRAHVIWYTAMSMDGRIAGAGDDMRFLEAIGPDPDGDAEWSAFVASIDAVVIGGATLRWLVSEGHGWPHGDLPTWLLSRDELIELAVGPTEAPLQRRTGDIAETFAEIDAAGHDRVWICGGGDVAGQALAIDRIDEVVVTVGPTALGAGPALFDAVDLPRREFTLAELRPYGANAARLVWRRDRVTPPAG